MTGFRVVAAALFGLAFGSFGSVLVSRTPARESIVSPGSRCPACGEPIRARDNIPVVSYVLLRGRCRSCRTRISLRYPALEIGTAGLFVAAALGFPHAYVAGMMAVFFGLLLAVAVVDAEHRIIPNAIIYPAVPLFGAAVLAGWALGAGLRPFSALAAALAYGGVLFVIAWVYPAGMGMGDVKLAVLIGLVLGSLGPAYPAVAAALAVLAGGLGGVVTLAITGGRARQMPFGPYMALGALVAAFTAPVVSGWYLSLFPA